MIEAQRGALEEAIACDRRAIEEFERVGHASGRAVAYANLGEKLLLAGRYEEAHDLCEQSIALADAIGNAYVLADATNTLAAVLAATGRFEDAAARADEAAHRFDEVGATADGERARAAAAHARSQSLLVEPRRA
jgi:tetratricopeptide (TPR) repeat protein